MLTRDQILLLVGHAVEEKFVKEQDHDDCVNSIATLALANKWLDRDEYFSTVNRSSFNRTMQKDLVIQYLALRNSGASDTTMRNFRSEKGVTLQLLSKWAKDYFGAHVFEAARDKNQSNVLVLRVIPNDRFIPSRDVLRLVDRSSARVYASLRVLVAEGKLEMTRVGQMHCYRRIDNEQSRESVQDTQTGTSWSTPENASVSEPF